MHLLGWALHLLAGAVLIYGGFMTFLAGAFEAANTGGLIGFGFLVVVVSGAIAGGGLLTLRTARRRRED